MSRPKMVTGPGQFSDYQPPRARPVKWTNPCETCGAQDNRDAEHARGCPALEPLTRGELIALARQIEAGWSAEAARYAARVEAHAARKLRSAAAA